MTKDKELLTAKEILERETLELRKASFLGGAAFLIPAEIIWDEGVASIATSHPLVSGLIGLVVALLLSSPVAVYYQRKAKSLGGEDNNPGAAVAKKCSVRAVITAAIFGFVGTLASSLFLSGIH